jgi:putative transcriptional regulator
MYINLRIIRNNSSISAKKMCDLLGLKTKAAYYKKENGNVNFTLSEAKKISDFFGMTIDEIFFESKCS